MKRLFTIFALLTLCGSLAHSQLLVENFDYPAGDSLRAGNGWYCHSASAGLPFILVSSPGLSYTNYIGSGVGNSVIMPGGLTGSDFNKAYATQTMGAIYAAFMVNVDTVNSTGEYFIHLGPNPIGSNFRGRVWVKDNGSGRFLFGIAKGGTPVTYTTNSFKYDSTYLVVLKCEFSQPSKLFVNPSLGGSEPTTGIIITSTDVTTDPANYGTIGLRQGSATNSPKVYVDGIRVATSWSEAAAEIPNDPPYIANALRDTSFSENFGRLMVRKLTEVFGDDDTPALTYGVSVLGSGITADIGTDTLYVNSTLDYTGDVSVRVTANDGSTTIADTFVVTVSGSGNQPPVVANALRDTSYSEDFGRIMVRKLTDVFSDPDTPSLTYSINVLGTGITADIGSDSLYINSNQNYNGSADVRVVADDGTTTVADTFTVTVNAENDPPVLTRNTGVGLDEGAGITITDQDHLRYDDPDNSASQLTYTLTAVPLNGTLKKTGMDLSVGNTFTQDDLNTDKIGYTHSGNETVTDTFKFTVSDGAGGNIPEQNFIFTINPVNDSPVISDITNKTTDEDTPITNIAFTIGDVDTPVGSLTLSGTSSNTTLVSNGNITFGGSGADRTLSITPNADQSGTTTISVIVSDGVASDTDTFVLTVTAVNDPPTISDITDKSTNEDTPINNIAFTVGDAETLAGSLTVSGTSSDTMLVSDGNIMFGGSGADRTLSITPNANQSGTTTISVIVSDGVASDTDTFVLTVTAVNDPPYLVQTFPDTSFGQNFGRKFIYKLSQFFADVDNPSLTYGATGSTGDVVPSISNDTLYVNSTLDFSGDVDIYVSAGDGEFTTLDTFNVSVTLVNDPPYVSQAVPDTTLPEDFGRKYIRKLTDVFTDPDNPTLTYGVSVLGGGGVTADISNDSLYINSVLNYNGTADVRVTARDASTTTADTFAVVVTPVNDAPVITEGASAEVTMSEDGSPTAFGLTLHASDTEGSTLTWSISSNAVNGSVAASGTGTSKVIGYVPVANYNGLDSFSIKISDGSLTDSIKVIVTLTPVNDPPTISDITDKSTNEDTPITNIAFTIGDVDTPVGSLTLSGTSSNTTLVSNGNITFGGSGADRTLSITPNADQSGTTTISVIVSDGVASDTDTFVLTVTAVNDPPTISDITDKSTNEDTPINNIAFTVGDAETPAGSLTVIGTSSNTTLVSNGNITFGGSGADRTLSITPNADQSGTTTISVIVSDGVASDTDTFVLTVTAVNDPPTISDITDKSTNEDTPINNIAFTVGDAETLAGSLTVSGTSSDTMLVSDGNIMFGGSGADRTLSITPNANQSGTTTISVIVSDGVASDSDTFVLTVTAVNDPPTITDITDKSTNEDTPITDISFTIDDLEMPAANLTLSRNSSNTTLVSNGNIIFGGTGANRTLSITPNANHSGTTTISVIVSDGVASDTDTFVLTVNTVNDPPMISDITDKSTNEDTPITNIAFTVGDIETPVADLTLSGTSSNTTLVSDGNIVFGGSGADRTLSITPNADQTGTTTISVIVSDGVASDTDTFVLTVNTVNDPPMISDITDKSTNEDTPITNIAFTVGDIETPVADLTLSGTSSNTTLVSDGNIVFGGSGADRTLSITSNADQTGTTTITVIVSDGVASDTDTFVLTVNAVNDAPYKISSMRDTTFSENFGRVGIADLNTVFDDVDHVSLSFTTSASGAGIVPGVSGDTLYISSTLNFNGDVDVYVNASDGEYTARDTFQVTVTAVNNAPYLVTMLRDTAYTEDFVQNFTYRLSQFFADVDNPALNYSATASGAGIIPEVSGDTLFISSTLNFNGAVDVFVSATDGEFTAYDTFSVTVTPVNDAPYVANPVANILLDEDFGKSYVASLSAVFGDADGGTLGYDAVSLSAGVNTLISGDSLYVLSVPDFTGMVDIRIWANDGEFTANDTFMVTVQDVNDPPVVVNALRDTSAAEDFGRMPVRLLTEVFGDIDNASLTYQAEVLGAGLTAGISQDTLYLNSELNYYGTVSLRVTAGDGLSTVSDTIDVTVDPVNDDPTVFSLISPADGDTLASITAPVEFRWQSSSDADPDVLSYTLVLYHPDFDTTIAGITDTTVTVDLNGRLISNAQYLWSVFVSDGTVMTLSSDTFAFRTPYVIGIANPAELPKAFSLAQNYPNPFNPATTIHFELPKQARVRLNIYNIQGQLVRTLVNGQSAAGRYHVIWDGRSDRGQTVSSGIYIYRIQAGDFVRTRKMMLLK